MLHGYEDQQVLADFLDDDGVCDDCSKGSEDHEVWTTKEGTPVVECQDNFF